MVDPVHPRGDDEPPEGAVRPGGQPYVAVVEEDHGQHHRLVDQHLPHGQSQHGKHRQSGQAGQQDLPRVKPHSGRGVHLPITVVNRVEAPQEWHLMVEPVPDVLPQVHQYDGGDQRPEGAELDPVEEAEG